jgi:type IV secretion system protein VirD4
LNVRAALYSVGAVAAALLLFLAWEAAYCVAVAWYSHSWALWTRFVKGLELLLPIQSALHEWQNPAAQKLVARATLGAVIFAVLIGVVVGQIVQNLRGAVPPTGGSRLAAERDLRKAGLLDGRPGYSIFLGRFNGKDVRYSGASHIYVNGPTRAGKGIGFVLPNALEWRGSLIGLDIKREMWKEIGAARAAMGQEVFLFSPGSAESHCWNPLDLVAPWPERATDVANIAHSLIPLPQSGDPYWAETARGLFAGLLTYVLDSATLKEARTIKSALKLFSRGRPLFAEMANILRDEPDLNEFVKDKFRQHISREEKQRQSFESHIVTALESWNNSLVDAATSRSDFDISQLRRKPFTILIGPPVGNFASVEAVVRLLVQQVHDVLLRNLPGVDEPHKLLLILDEFFQFGRMPEIVDRAPLVAGYGFQIAVIAQGLTQLDVRYGKPTRDMLIGNMDVKLLIGVGDEVTASYCSAELGKHYVRREGWGTSVGAGLVGAQARATRSIQGRWELEPLITSEAMRRFDQKKSVLLVRGEFGAVVDKAHFFRDSVFTRQVEAAQPFGHRNFVPDVNAERSRTIASSPAPMSQPLGLKHQIAKDRVMREARALFTDATMFETCFVWAMTERANHPTAELLQTLRIEPGRFGELRVARRRQPSKVIDADPLTGALRREILSARRLLNDERAELTAPAATISPGAPSDTVSKETPPENGMARTTIAISPGALAGDKTTAGGAHGEVATASDDVLWKVAEVGTEAVTVAKIVTEHLPSVNPTQAEQLENLLNALERRSALFADTPNDLAQAIGHTTSR